MVPVSSVIIALVKKSQQGQGTCDNERWKQLNPTCQELTFDNAAGLGLAGGEVDEGDEGEAEEEEEEEADDG